ncbi:MAG: phosphomannomutase/phosphoglucomutase [Candidatus Cloacimonetes bacterium]|nr:phosphomannomutase/phosphoglucomutase [Candidatus Cloacimonadota bacterium]
MSIFKAYDIRGLVPQELNEDLAWRIGRAAAEFFGAQRFLVGSDDRSSRDMLFNALTRGLRDQGVDVVDIGKVSTPILYYTLADRNFDAGVMITASHNPGGYNGFKFCRKDAQPVPQEMLNKIRDLVERNSFRSLGYRGTISSHDPFPAYKTFISKTSHLERRYKVVVDTGNAVCGLFLADLYKDTPLDIVPMYFESDPTFPNHEPNPLEDKNTADLRKRVVAEKADLGIALDGDGDRIMFIDENGIQLAGDITTLLIALGLQESGAGNFDVVVDCRSSRAVEEILKEHGLTCTRSRVGHTFIKGLMRKNDSLCGGELSGHYYFKANSFTENTDLALFTILRMLDKRNCRLSELVAPMLRYVQSGEINSHVDSVDSTLERIRSQFADGRQSQIDGLTVEYDSWWFNVRPSNTEPLLRLNLEAADTPAMELHRDRVLAVIRNP